MIEQVQAYQCICDGCKKGFNTDGEDWPNVWINKDDLIIWLENSDDEWTEKDGKWYCYECNNKIEEE